MNREALGNSLRVEGMELVVRPYLEMDRAAFTTLVTDPMAMAPLGGPAACPAELFERVLREPTFADGAWAVIHSASGHYVGHIFIQPGRLIRDAEIGFVFSPSVWELGFAQHAVSSLVSALRALEPERRLGATVDDGNRRAERVLVRAGFEFRGTQSDEQGPYRVYALPVVPAATTPTQT